MIISVMDRQTAKRVSFCPIQEKTIIISINDAFQELNRFAKNPNIIGVCSVSFDDVESGCKNCITSEDAVKIVNFFCEFQKKAERLIVHCGAGISRSAGVAGAIALIVNGSDKEIFDNPKFHPNMTVYRKILNEFMKRS